MGFLSKHQQDFISCAGKSNIKWADATRHIPEKDTSVGVVYSSHMIEHLEREDALKFLKESRRILKSGGVIRLAVPDIRHYAVNYLKSGDADRFVDDTRLTRKKPKTIIEKIKYLVTGDRGHKWMYDGRSLCKLLSTAGFRVPR